MSIFPRHLGTCTKAHFGWIQKTWRFQGVEKVQGQLPSTSFLTSVFQSRCWRWIASFSGAFNMYKYIYIYTVIDESTDTQGSASHKTLFLFFTSKRVVRHVACHDPRAPSWHTSRGQLRRYGNWKRKGWHHLTTSHALLGMHWHRPKSEKLRSQRSTIAPSCHRSDFTFHVRNRSQRLTQSSSFRSAKRSQLLDVASK